MPTEKGVWIRKFEIIGKNVVRRKRIVKIKTDVSKHVFNGQNWRKSKFIKEIGSKLTKPKHAFPTASKF